MLRAMAVRVMVAAARAGLRGEIIVRALAELAGLKLVGPLWIADEIEFALRRHRPDALIVAGNALSPQSCRALLQRHTLAVIVAIPDDGSSAEVYEKFVSRRDLPDLDVPGL